LQQYLDSVRNVPFAWGEHDCALLAAKHVDAVHGTSFVARIKQYGCKSARDYRRMQRAGATLKALAIAQMGPPREDAIKRGDVVLVRARQQTLGLAVPPLVLVAGESGLMPLPLGLAICHWRIG
jgi:hypothetical protein